jgi:superfamily II DNA or RNA helicase
MYELEQYQENGVQEAQRLLAIHQAIIYQLATGGGKTVVFSAISKRYITATPYNVLILVHRKELLKQTRRTLHKGFGVTAQPVVAGMRYIPDNRVYIGMVKTIQNRIEKFSKMNFGLVIIDEAHYGHFKKIHAQFPNAKIIGFTATPLSTNRKDPLKNYYQEIVCGIDIPELIELNKTRNDRGLIQNVTFNQKDIVDRAALVSDSGGNDFDEGLMAIQFSKPKYIKGVVDAYEKKEHGTKGTKAIIFNCNRAHSKLVAAEFIARGYPCKHLDSKSDEEYGKGYRDATLAWFHNTPGAILCNVDILTAGFDEPTIETVIVNRSTMSLTKWLQMCGRGARPLTWKSMFYIIDMGGNAAKLGDWCDPRDWRDIFFNPPKPNDGSGIAPTKDCPECDAVVPAQSMTCRYCGYEFPRKVEAVEGPLGEFVVVTKGINVKEVIAKNKDRKEHAIFLGIGTMLADNAKNFIREMTDQDALFILEQYHVKAEEWTLAVGKQYNDWYRARAKEHLYDRLKNNYPKWQRQSTTPQNPTHAR